MVRKQADLEEKKAKAKTNFGPEETEQIVQASLGKKRKMQAGQREELTNQIEVSANFQC